MSTSRTRLAIVVCLVMLLLASCGWLGGGNHNPPPSATATPSVTKPAASPTAHPSVAARPTRSASPTASLKAKAEEVRVRGAYHLSGYVRAAYYKVRNGYIRRVIAEAALRQRYVGPAYLQLTDQVKAWPLDVNVSWRVRIDKVSFSGPNQAKLRTHETWHVTAASDIGPGKRLLWETNKSHTVTLTRSTGGISGSWQVLTIS